MKQSMMNTAAGALAAVLLGSAGLAWADGFDPWLADGLNKQIQQNREAQQQPTYHGPTAAEIRAWEQREAEVQAEIAELRRTPFYMAIINDFGTDRIAYAGGFRTEQRAIEDAMSFCRSGNCQVLTTFSNSCAVLTFPAGRELHSVSDFFFGYDRDHNRAAEKSIRACEARHGKGNCLYSASRTKNGTAFCTGYDYSNYNQR